MSEREKFEAWAKSEGVDTWKTPSDEYLLFMTRTCYSAWQAAKAESAAEIAALRTELEEARKPAKFYSCCKQHMGLPFTLAMKYQSQAHTVTVCPHCEKLAEAVAAIDAAKEQGK